MTSYKLFISGINFIFFIILIILFVIGYFLLTKSKKIIGLTIIFTAIIVDLFLSTQAVLLTSPLLEVKAKKVPVNTKIYTVPPDQKPLTIFFRPDIEQQFAKEKKELMLPNQNILYGIYALDGYASMAQSAYINQFTDANKTVTGLGKLDISKIDFSKHGVNFVISKQGIYKTDNSRDRYFLDESGTINVINQTPTEMIFKIDAKRDTKFNVLDTWYPGWNATIDNRYVSIKKFEHVYKSIDVSKGNHIVRLYFYPKSFVIGSIIFAVSIITLILSLPFIKNRKI